MKALNLGRQELVMLEGALNLAVDMMEHHQRKQPDDLAYAELIEDHRSLAAQMGQLVSIGDAADAMGQAVEAGATLESKCKKCGYANE